MAINLWNSCQHSVCALLDFCMLLPHWHPLQHITSFWLPRMQQSYFSKSVLTAANFHKSFLWLVWVETGVMWKFLLEITPASHLLQEITRDRNIFFSVFFLAANIVHKLQHCKPLPNVRICLGLVGHGWVASWWGHTVAVPLHVCMTSLCPCHKVTVAFGYTFDYGE